MNYSRFLFCVGFCLLIAVAASVKAGSDYRCPPVFNDSKHRLVYDHCDSASFTFKATPPKSRRGEYPADGIIRYRQLKGPGALDSVSGYWSMPAGTQVEWYNSLVLFEAYWQSKPSLKTRTGLILVPKNQMPAVVLDGFERRDPIPIPFG